MYLPITIFMEFKIKAELKRWSADLHSNHIIILNVWMHIIIYPHQNISANMVRKYVKLEWVYVILFKAKMLFYKICKFFINSFIYYLDKNASDISYIYIYYLIYI